MPSSRAKVTDKTLSSLVVLPQTLPIPPPPKVRALISPKGLKDLVSIILLQQKTCLHLLIFFELNHHTLT